MRNYDYMFTDVELSDELKHYGHKGMKWYQHIYGRLQTGGYAKGAQTKGVKGGDNKTGTSGEKKKDRKPRQVQEYDKLKQKKASEMTDAEIKRMMDRMDLEKRLNAKRYEANKSKLDKFMDKYGDQLVKAGTDFAKEQGAKVVDKMLKKALGEDGAQGAHRVTQEMAQQMNREANYYSDRNRLRNAQREWENGNNRNQQPQNNNQQQRQENNNQQRQENNNQQRQERQPEQQTQRREESTPEPTRREQAEQHQTSRVQAARDEANRREEAQVDEYGYRRRRRYNR